MLKQGTMANAVSARSVDRVEGRPARSARQLYCARYQSSAILSSLDFTANTLLIQFSTKAQVTLVCWRSDGVRGLRDTESDGNF